jgi:hypothetical protein
MARGKLAELFYDLRASTEGLDRDLKDAEGQFGKLAAYVKAHPVAAVGAISAAMLGVGIAAAKMAEQVESELRKVEARVPGTTAQMTQLRDTIREMSLAGPRSQAELAGAAAEIARQGGNSIEEVQKRLAIVTKVADATGEDLTGIIGGLDQAMDMFGLSADDAEGFLAQLYATAKNRMPITDLFGAFQAAAPAVRDFGLDAETTMRALGALLERGMNAKQAASELKQYGAAGREGAAEIRKLAGTYDLAADAVARLNTAQATMNASAENSWKTIKNNLNAAMIDLGQTILPTVTKEFQGLVGILDHFNGTLDQIEGKRYVGTLVTGFSTSGKGVSAKDFRKQTYDANLLAGQGQLNLGGLSVAQLDRIITNIKAMSRETGQAEGQFVSLYRAIAAARQEAEKLEKAPKPGSKPAGTGSGGVRTADQVTKDLEAAKAAGKAADEALERQAAAISRAVEQALRAIDAREKAVAQIREELADDLVNSTATKLDDIALAYDRKITAALAAEAPEEAETWRRRKQRALDVQQVIEDTDEAARSLGLRFGDVANANKGVTSSTARTTQELLNQARALQQAVDGALQLADAFGLMDERTANTLRSVAQIAANIPALTNAWKTRGESGSGGLGAVIGAGLPVAGAAASIISGLVSSAKAAREHAKALVEARGKLTESLQDRIGRSGLTDQQQRERDRVQQQRADLTAMLDLLVQSPGIRIGTRDEFLAKDEGGQRKVLTDALAREKAKFPAGFESSLMRALEDAIKQFDLIADASRKAAEAMAAELAEKRKDVDASLAERRLALAGKTEETDALRFARQQEKELADARAGGVYTAAQLAELEALLGAEREKYIADQKKRRDEEAAQKAREVQQGREDLQTRINAANGETPEERARRQALEREREVLDWMAKGADATTLALLALAQAADAAAQATREKIEAEREMQDLEVELLRAQGKADAADARQFELDLQRQYDDAVAAGKSPEFLAKLAEVQAAKRAQRAAQTTAAATSAGAEAGMAAGAGGEAGVSSASTGVQTATVVQVDRMLGLLGTLVAYSREELDVLKDFVAAAVAPRAPLLPPSLPSSFSVGSGGQLIQIRVQLTQQFYGPVGGGREGGQAVGQAALEAINVGLANVALLTAQGRGEVGR